MLFYPRAGAEIDLTLDGDAPATTEACRTGRPDAAAEQGTAAEPHAKCARQEPGGLAPAAPHDCSSAGAADAGRAEGSAAWRRKKRKADSTAVVLACLLCMLHEKVP